MGKQSHLRGPLYTGWEGFRGVPSAAGLGSSMTSWALWTKESGRAEKSVAGHLSQTQMEGTQEDREAKEKPNQWVIAESESEEETPRDDAIS